jgi:hypothetical protein
MLYRKQREEEQRKEAELKMLQHWRINNPAARQVTSSPLFTPGFRIRIDLMRIRIRVRIQHFF